MAPVTVAFRRGRVHLLKELPPGYLNAVPRTAHVRSPAWALARARVAGAAEPSDQSCRHHAIHHLTTRAKLGRGLGKGNRAVPSMFPGPAGGSSRATGQRGGRAASIAMADGPAWRLLLRPGIGSRAIAWRGWGAQSHGPAFELATPGTRTGEAAVCVGVRKEIRRSSMKLEQEEKRRRGRQEGPKRSKSNRAEADAPRRARERAARASSR